MQHDDGAVEAKDNPAGLDWKLVHEGNRLEVVATFAGSEARERMGSHVLKMDDARQQFFIRRATIAAMRKVLRKHRRKLLQSAPSAARIVNPASE